MSRLTSEHALPVGPLAPVRVFPMPMRMPMAVRMDGTPVRPQYRPQVWVTRPAVQVHARPVAAVRPRERSGSRRVVSTRAGPKDDPEPAESALNAVWTLALDTFSSTDEFQTLAELARIRSIWLGRWAA